MKELLEIQGKLKVAKKNSGHGGQYHYRKTSEILEQAKPLCIGLGVLLTVSDKVVQVGNDNYIVSTATASKDGVIVSCEGWAKEPLKLMTMSAPQITGSCSSYARKTALGGLFAIDDNEDPDEQKPTKKSEEEVNIKQQILNRLSTLTETEKDGYRAEMQAGNWKMDKTFLDHLVSKYGSK